jgi:hypothetical protein
MPRTKNSVVKYDDALLQDIETIIEECGLTAATSKSHVKKALELSQGIQRLQDLITPDMMKAFMALQGSTLGFITDKDDKGGYPENTVKRCLIEGLLRGAYPVNNEINIIAGKCYLTQNYMVRKAHTWPGIAELKDYYGVPAIKGSEAHVQCKATWKLDGKEDSLGYDPPCVIPVRVNSAMGVDAVLGKAKRKFLARIINQLTGTRWITETDDGELSDIQPIEKEFPEKEAVTVDNVLRGTVTQKPIQFEVDSKADEQKFKIIMSGGDVLKDLELHKLHFVPEGKSMVGFTRNLDFAKEAQALGEGAGYDVKIEIED